MILPLRTERILVFIPTPSKESGFFVSVKKREAFASLFSSENKFFRPDCRLPFVILPVPARRRGGFDGQIV